MQTKRTFPTHYDLPEYLEPTSDNAEAVKALAKQCVNRVFSRGLRGKSRDNAAMEMFMGAVMLANAVGDRQLLDRLMLAAALRVAPRGFQAVQELAEG